jgi:hypothetical protein
MGWFWCEVNANCLGTSVRCSLSHPIAAHFPKSYAIPVESRFSTFGTATVPSGSRTKKEKFYPRRESRPTF